MCIKLSVVIPTYNPNRNRLNRTLDALKQQTLEYGKWELIVVDNATPDINYVLSFDISWHPQSRVIREERQGLTRARIAGIRDSQGDYLVFVDDDNVIDENYLKNTINIFQQHSDLGVFGGKSLPAFEVKPEPWIREFWKCLALRDLGEEAQIYSWKGVSNTLKQHPEFAPIGAGMALRRTAAHQYADEITTNKERLAFDRTGKSLQSGGDCDINLTLLAAGWKVGYFPQLKLTHLISGGRLSRDYLARLNRASSRSWIQVLDVHGIRVWQKIPRWTVLLRQVKAFFFYQPWKDPASYIRWQGACGMYEGQAKLL